MTRLEPAAYLAVDGVDVARTSTAGVPDRLLAMDGLVVTWGREESLDQQDPAVASVTVFDPSRSWHRSRTLVGSLVTLRWSITVAGVTTTRTFFRGRITRVNPVIRTLQGVRGTLVTLDLASIVADLGNVVPTVQWPHENWGVVGSSGARRFRVSDAVVAAGIPGGLLFAPSADFDGFAAAQVDLDDQISIADHVRLVYDSMVDRMNYSPQDNRFSAVGSRDYATRNSLGRLVSDPPGAATDRAGQGVYARARVLNGGEGLYLNAREVDYPDDAGIVRDQTSAITRIRLATTELISSVEVKTVVERVVTGANEALTGIRTMNVDSAISSSARTRQLDRWETLIRQDAATWQLEPLTVRTGPVGGLEELAQLTTLLSGEESNALVFLQASELPLYGCSPVVFIKGGTITHQDGHWEVEAIVMAAPLVAAQHSITAEELDTGTPATQIQAWDTPHPLGLHASLTWEDLAWVGVGHGVDPGTAWFPTNLGWDYTP